MRGSRGKINEGSDRKGGGEGGVGSDRDGEAELLKERAGHH